MSASDIHITNLNVSHRQPKLFFGPLLGIFLANLLSNSAFAKFAPLGSIRLEYDPLPFLNFARPYPIPPHQPTTQKPEVVQVINHSQHVTEKPELVEILDHPPQPDSTNEYLIHDSVGNHYYLESPPDKPLLYKKPEITKEGIRDIVGEATNIDLIEINNTKEASQDNNNSKYLGANLKNHVKRQTYRYPYNKYFNRGNKYSQYSPKRRYSTPVDYFEDDSYEDISTRRYYRPNSNKRRYQNGRRPINFEDDYDDYFNDFDYDAKPTRKPQRKNRNKFKTRNKQDSEDDEDPEFDDDVESVTLSAKPRQRQTTTTTTAPEATEMTNITTGVTPSSNNNTSGPYGYGPSNGNENISITYAPPLAQKPVYGPPSSGYGAPEYNPSSVYGFSSPTFGTLGYPGLSSGSQGITYGSFTPIESGSAYNTLGGSHVVPSTSYGTPISSYGAPGTTYGKPSYGPPKSSYGIPTNTYGVPSNSYSTPSSSYGAPSSSYGAPPSNSYASPGGTYETAGGYQSYQLPYSSWYKKGSSRIELARRAQDILSYDGLYKESFKK